MKRLVVIGAFVVGALAPRAAYAYRPFDGTDADVAETGDIELEIGPLQGSLTHGSTSYQPGFVFNDGISAGYELVVDADLQAPLGTTSSDKLVVSDVLVKHVLRKGSLQNGVGPSVAIETGVLLPNIPVQGSAHGINDAGWSFALITSQRWKAGTIHLNLGVEYARDRQAVAVASVILEGPNSWTVRPVAEFLTERDENYGNLSSALVGALWRVREDLVVDFAVRAQYEASTTTLEIRAGVTWAFAD